MTKHKWKTPRHLVHLRRHPTMNLSSLQQPHHLQFKCDVIDDVIKQLSQQNQLYVSYVSPLRISVRVRNKNSKRTGNSPLALPACVYIKLEMLLYWGYESWKDALSAVAAARLIHVAIVFWLRFHRLMQLSVIYVGLQGVWNCGSPGWNIKPVEVCF